MGLVSPKTESVDCNQIKNIIKNNVPLGMVKYVVAAGGGGDGAEPWNVSSDARENLKESPTGEPLSVLCTISRPPATLRSAEYSFFETGLGVGRAGSSGANHSTCSHGEGEV